MTTLSKTTEKGPMMLAFKSLHHIDVQDELEFWRKIMMLSRYRHENLVSLFGFCNEGEEKILVYEYASHNSLNRYLSNPSLTWTQRLKICVAAASGLNYLHGPNDGKLSVVHGDIKSSNIVLDEKWTAKLSDWGIQKYMGLRSNIENANHLTKESDIYSFGVVLFEVMCGCEYSKARVKKVLVPMWQERNKKKEIDKVIIQELRLQMEEKSLHKFAAIAYKCIQPRDHSDRPTMDKIIEELQAALKLQLRYDREEKNKEERELIEISGKQGQVASRRSPTAFHKLLSEGFVHPTRHTWFSVNHNMEHCEMILATRCFKRPDETKCQVHQRVRLQRMLVSHNTKLSTRISYESLSPRVTYAIYIVYEFKGKRKTSITDRYMPFTCYINGHRMLTSYFAAMRENGWMMNELCQFTSHTRKLDEVDFELEIDFQGDEILLIGLECRPLEKMRLDEWQDLSDLYCEQKLPNDYLKIVKRSKDIAKYKTKKDQYLLLRNGFQMNKCDRRWFFIDRKGKKCYMLGVQKVLEDGYCELIPTERLNAFSKAHSLSNRFDWVAKFHSEPNLGIDCEVESKFLSPKTTYAAYLVFTLIEDDSTFTIPLKVKQKHFLGHSTVMGVSDVIFLVSPQTSVIDIQVGHQERKSPLNRPKIDGTPNKRSDGWMEVKLWEFQSDTMEQSIRMCVDVFTFDRSNLRDFLLQGVEIRPI